MLHHAFGKCDAETVQIVFDEFVDKFGILKTKEILSKRKNDNETVLMLAARNKNEKVFEIRYDFIDADEHVEILYEKDENGKNVFVWATMNTNAENFKIIKNIYERKVEKKYMKEILTENWYQR